MEKQLKDYGERKKDRTAAAPAEEAPPSEGAGEARIAAAALASTDEALPRGGVDEEAMAAHALAPNALARTGGALPSKAAEEGEIVGDDLSPTEKGLPGEGAEEAEKAAKELEAQKAAKQLEAERAAKVVKAETALPQHRLALASKAAELRTIDAEGPASGNKLAKWVSEAASLARDVVEHSRVLKMDSFSRRMEPTKNALSSAEQRCVAGKEKPNPPSPPLLGLAGMQGFNTPSPTARPTSAGTAESAVVERAEAQEQTTAGAAETDRRTGTAGSAAECLSVAPHGLSSSHGAHTAAGNMLPVLLRTACG